MCKKRLLFSECELMAVGLMTAVSNMHTKD